MQIDVILFIILFMSMAFDWIFQTQQEGLNKIHDSFIRFKHTLTVGILTTGLVAAFGYNIFVLLFVFFAITITHYLIDDRKLVVNIMVFIKQIPPGKIYEYGWMAIVIDQWLHMIVNFVIAIIVGTLII